MLNKIVPMLRVAAELQLRRSSHGVPAHWKTLSQIAHEQKSHMNFLPVPEGSWKKAYDAKNSKRNVLLIASIFAFLGTYGFLWKSNVIYLHSAPPTYNCKKQ
ncbi:apoptosis-inducing factor 1 mitochondrial-like isoform X2 [Biomphalaria pfeifferi]|uniref:Apoptosis-inducing factor 1 mitochondrial-like isoform X2 n=1 Tax=Biomphalaria pfeifferi TaxID=112525 RepID=A0AAD8C166_BIOPF|nr:apoptosis-inducing factor 1 mitochondrial-like isoform X2 [Biomphalaria pfeifferi]